MKTKRCEVCGNPYHPRKGETTKRFNLRRACSQKCSGILRRKHKKIAPPRTCEQCGQPYSKPVNLALTRWRKRRFCGNPCAQAYIQSRRHQKHLNLKKKPVLIDNGFSKFKSYQEIALVGEGKVNPTGSITITLFDGQVLRLRKPDKHARGFDWAVFYIPAKEKREDKIPQM